MADAAVLEQRGTPQRGAVIAAEVVENLTGGAAHDVAVANEGLSTHSDASGRAASTAAIVIDRFFSPRREHRSETGPSTHETGPSNIQEPG